MKPKRIGIVGGGFVGLTAALKLSQKGHQVFVFEKEKVLGGLAAGFKKESWQWPLERFYHHFFVSDTEVKKLIKNLNLTSKLFYLKPKTAIFKNGTFCQFDSPFSLFTFPYLSLPEKIRTAIMTTFLKLTNDWQKLEKINATEWLAKFYGENVCQTLWWPLLAGKFGHQKKVVNMAWFWARIKKRSSSLGYLEGGLQTLINKIAEEIKKNGGQIFLNQEVKNINKLKKEKKLDQIIVTTPAAIFLKITSNLPQNYQTKLKKLAMIGTINLVLEVKEKFLKDNIYWLNINEPDFPFVAVVEHTNFIDPKYYGHQHLVYVGGYYSPHHRYFKMTKEQIFKEFLPYLKKIRPSLNFKSSILKLNLFSNPHTQPIMPINYSQMRPSFKTPLPGIFLANMQMVYPWDRGVNYAVKLGQNVADEILKR